MIGNRLKFGFNARGKLGRSWKSEVNFAKENTFDLLQLYCTGSSGLKELRTQKEEVEKAKFPLIIHAVLDIVEVGQYIEELVDSSKSLSSKELIIHPGNENGKSIRDLSAEIGKANNYAKENGVKLFLENNSKKHPIFHSAEEIKLVFEENEDVAFLLDLAHIDDLEHLERMVDIKRPEILHIADRHLEVLHEHLPIGQGNIDFKRIFGSILSNFGGKIIFEIQNGLDDDFMNAKRIITSFLT